MSLADRFRHLRHLVHCCLYFPLLFSLRLAPHARSTRKKTAPLATVTTTWGSFLESPDNKRSRRAVVVDIQDRGINSFADNMIKLSARTRAFDLNIWFRLEKLAELSRNGSLIFFLHYLCFQTLFPVSNPRRLQLWVDYFLRYDETAWSTQDPAIQDEDGDSEVRQVKIFSYNFLIVEKTTFNILVEKKLSEIICWPTYFDIRYGRHTGAIYTRKNKTRTFRINAHFV